jgi:hypothetical protein
MVVGKAVLLGGLATFVYGGFIKPLPPIFGFIPNFPPIATYTASQLNPFGRMSIPEFIILSFKNAFGMVN